MGSMKPYPLDIGPGYPTPPGSVYPNPSDLGPGYLTPSPPLVLTTPVVATEPDGTNPTGMLSCLNGDPSRVSLTRGLITKQSKGNT